MTALTTATCTSGWVEHPFNHLGDSTTKVYHHEMRVKATSYAPLDFDDVMTAAGDKPTGSPFADDSAAYWVGDVGLTPSDGGMLRFERVFANVPQERIEAGGIQLVTYPGSIGAVTASTITETTDVTPAASYSTTTNLITLNCSTSTIHYLGERMAANVTIDTYFLTSDGSQGRAVSGISTIDGNWVITNIVDNGTYYALTLTYDVAKWHPFIDLDNVTLTVGNYTTLLGYPSLAERDAVSYNSQIKQKTRYVRDSNFDNEAVPKKFGVYVSAYAIGYLGNNLSGSSKPSATEYARMMEAGALYHINDAQVRRWMGNIWEIVETYTIAR